MSNVKNIKNVNNANNTIMLDYAKLNDDLEIINNNISFIKSIINLDLDYIEKVKQTGDNDKDVLTLFELTRLKEHYTNINLDVLDKLKDMDNRVNAIIEKIGG